LQHTRDHMDLHLDALCSFQRIKISVVFFCFSTLNLDFAKKNFSAHKH